MGKATSPKGVLFEDTGYYLPDAYVEPGTSDWRVIMPAGRKMACWSNIIDWWPLPDPLKQDA